MLPAFIILKKMPNAFLLLISIISSVILTEASTSYPVSIRSHSLFIDIRNHRIKFSGNVIVKYNNFYIFTDQMIIFYRDRKIEKVVFLYKIQLVKNNKIISGISAEYNRQLSFLKIIGNITYINGSQQILGNYFTHYFKTKISRLSSKSNIKKECY